MNAPRASEGQSLESQWSRRFPPRTVRARMEAAGAAEGSRTNATDDDAGEAKEGGNDSSVTEFPVVDPVRRWPGISPAWTPISIEGVPPAVGFHAGGRCRVRGH